MGSGFSKLKKKARHLEEQFSKMQEEMKSKEITGVSAGGLVTVTLRGDKEMKSIRILPDCVRPDDIEGLQDLIVTACQDAYSKINQSEEGLPFSPEMLGL